MVAKILMLNSITNESGGGVQFWSIAKELVGLGCEVLFLERTTPRTKRRKDSRIHYGAIRDTGLLGLDIPRATALNLFRGLLFRPDYVFALKPMPNTCIPALVLKAVFKSTVILDIDDLDFAYYSDRFKRGLVRSWFSLFPQHFDLLTTPSIHLQDYILKNLRIPRERVYFLAQGIESERFLRASPNEVYRKRYGLDGNDKVIVYCASLGITSDFDVVLPVLTELLQDSPDIKILVIGDGVRRQYFVNEVKACGLQNSIIFTGYIPHSDMPGLLRLARVGINYMVPSVANQYRTSIKVREYLAAGLNVVCNPVGDAEIFQDYVVLCPAIEEFPNAIRKALERNNQKMIGEAQAFVENRYAWPRLVEGFLNHLINSDE